MGEIGGFLKYARRDPGYREVEDRLRDYRDVARRLTDRDLREQAARCMTCGIPFCHAAGCPVTNFIPEFNDLVYRNRWREALSVLLAGGCFPEFTGRVCPAPCEGSCVLGIHDDPVSIRQVELAIIEKGFERGYMEPRPPVRRREERVAVVGSGPAGLAAAHTLNRAGCRVVVYENAPKPGGILRYGIPDFKLEKWVVDRRVQLMKDEGVEFEIGVRVGDDISLRFLRGRFDVVVLTGGAMEPRDLDVPGRELTGIHFAMDYLVQQNLRLDGIDIEPASEILAADKSVVIIGGGDTGSDCLGTALRQGARCVRQFEILPEPPPTRSETTPWPLWPLQRRDSSSHREGGERRWSVATKAFRGGNGRVEELDCIEVEWKNGAPHDVPGTEFTVEAELVLLAMGFVGPGPNRLVEELGLALDTRGFLQRDQRHMTSAPGIFVAGDMSRGASLVVRAIQDGRQAAAGVLDWLDASRS